MGNKEIKKINKRGNKTMNINKTNKFLQEISELKAKYPEYAVITFTPEDYIALFESMNKKIKKKEYIDFSSVIEKTLGDWSLIEPCVEVIISRR